MRLIFIGPPGSGKGTQAKLLSERLDLMHFATGDLLRDAIRNDTEAGRLASTYVDAGQLVPDHVVNEFVKEVFAIKNGPENFVMDGYPRTLGQAKWFDKFLKQERLDLDAVIFLAVADEEIIKRISARWSCPQPTCKATYNTLSKPPKQPGVCDACGSALAQREDDKAETVRKRLEVFHASYDELLEHYRKQGMLIEVPGVGSIENIYNSIETALKQGVPSKA
jgi:adenylate kinase